MRGASVSFLQVLFWLCLPLLVVLGTGAALAWGESDGLTLAERVTPEILKAVFPEADAIGPPEGSPEAAPALKAGETIGWVFSTKDVVAQPGYSGTIFDIIAGVDLKGIVTGARAIYHHEAFIERDPLRQQELEQFLDLMAGTERSTPRQQRPDFVKSATVSARTMRAAVFDAARIVMQQHGGRPPVTEPTLDLDGFHPMTPEELQAGGALVSATLTNAEALARLAQVDPSATLDVAPRGDDAATYIKVYTALITPAGIGRNVLGGERYKRLFADLTPRPMAILVASEGRYDFIGTSLFHRATGYRLDRVELVQGDNTIVFTRDLFQRVGAFTKGFPTLPYGALLTIPPETDFDPLKPWQLNLIVHGKAADGTPISFTMPVNYQLPSDMILMPEPEPPPPWLEAWIDAKVKVGILAAALLALTFILAFQSKLTRSRRLHRWLRNGFLVFTLVWIGWIAGAQLSTIHLLNYALAPIRNYNLGFYLAEPLILIVAVYALIGVIMLGRGVFCGWLCPFGAMQELLANIARFLKLPQWNPPEAVQRKAWLVKYVAAAAVVFVAFTWPEMETTAAEVEPFKTAITSMFDRPWPFIAYAVVLLGIGLFTERAYCRFLCPLGGILAVLDRLHLINLLKRRPECGSPCQLCSRSCPVKAIERSGRIKMAECFQCLDCQVEYYDDHRCPPLVKERKRRERTVMTPPARPVLQPVAARTAERPA